MEMKVWLKRKIKRFKKTKRFSSKKMMVLGTTLLILFACFSIYQIFILPELTLKGEKRVIINYKTKYQEKGYKASQYGKDLTKKVKIAGKVKVNKLGTYKIEYKVGNGIFSRKKTRIVIVKDIEKPKIEIDNKDIYLCPGDEFVKEKVVATDNYDGDISNRVKITLNKEKSKVTYSVIDKSGNKKEIVKNIYYKDIEKPELALNGNEVQYIYLGDEWKDPSITIKDNCDSDLGENITIDGTVNNNTVGEYEITYIVKDKSGNESKISRKVKVNERSKNGSIYLTFDDGPNSGTTDVILDILKEEGVKATFFVTNKGPDELIKREYDEGHTVALHTATHDYSIVYASGESYFNDLYSVQDRVKRITGYESKIIRFPGGSSNTVSRRYSNGIMTYLTQETLNRGFRYYDWNLSSGDAAGGTPTADDIYNNVVNSLRKDRMNMVLMHDIKPYTRDALKRIIEYGKANGYYFEKITMETEMVTQRVNN